MIRLDALVERKPEGKSPYLAIIGEAVPIDDFRGLAVVLRELPEPDEAGEYRFLLMSPKPITGGDFVDDEIAY